MKNFINRLICLLLGHKDVEEVYAERRTAYRGRHSIYFYRVVSETICLRCGRVESTTISPWMRRSEMLKKGGLLKKNSKNAIQNRG